MDRTKICEKVTLAVEFIDRSMVFFLFLKKLKSFIRVKFMTDILWSDLLDHLAVTKAAKTVDSIILKSTAKGMQNRA